MGITDRVRRFFKKDDVDLGQIADLMRSSVISPSTFRTPTGTIIIPDDTKSYGFRRINIEDTNDLPRSKVINYLIKSNESLRFAVDTYVDYTVQDFTIDAEDTKDFDIITEFIKQFPKGKAGFMRYLKQLAYGHYVEGGCASEMVNGEDGMPIKTVYVSPWTLAAKLKKDDIRGEYYVYGQRKQASNRELTVLEDEANPNKKFIYLPAHQDGDDPFGSSQVTPALFTISAMQDLISNIVNWTRGRVYPKHIYSIDTKTLADAGFTAPQIAQAASKATALIKGTLDGTDITEDIVLSVPIVATLVGAMEKSGIDGVEMIIDIFERKEQRGLKVPRVLYGSRRAASGLQDNESRVEWLAFNKRLVNIRKDLQEVANFHFADILGAMGSLGEAFLKLSDDDPELNRINAELFKMEMEGWVQISRELTDKIITREETRRKFIESNPLFNDLDVELPEELEKMEMMPDPMNPEVPDLEPMEE